MGKEKEIVAFASKWYDIFHNNRVKYSDELDKKFCADCDALGFDISVGEDILENEYKDPIEDDSVGLRNVYVLAYLLHKINDLNILGSMIYYFWIDFIAYFYLEFQPIDDDDLTWLLVVLNHLKTVAMQQKPLFDRPISNICLRSDIRKRDFNFQSSVGVFQELSIDESGDVSFKKYGLTSLGELKQLDSSGQVQLEQDTVQAVLDAIRIFLIIENAVKFNQNLGRWEATIVDNSGNPFYFNGYLNEDCFFNTTVSTFVRKKLNVFDLLCFDGYLDEFIISKLTIVYIYYKSANDEKYTRCELLELDRENETIEIKVDDELFKANHKFQFYGSVSRLLNSREAKELIKSSNKIDNRQRNCDSIHSYRLLFNTNMHGTRSINGCFDYYGLPLEYQLFIYSLQSLLKSISYLDIFDRKLIGKKVCIVGQYIVCVVAHAYSNNYGYYLSKEDNISVDDYVVVPGINDDKEIIGQVVNVSYLDLKNLPKDVNELKYIIRKTDYEQWDKFKRKFKRNVKPVTTKVVYPSDYVVVHVETTGLKPQEDHIIEIGAIKYKDYKEVDRFSCLVNPNVTIRSLITEITGISNEDVMDKPTIDVVLPQLLGFIADLPLLVYNVKFDMEFIDAACRSVCYTPIDNEVINVFDLVHKTLTLENYKLSSVRTYLGLTNINLVNAIDDCIVTNEAYIHCLKMSSD